MEPMTQIKTNEPWLPKPRKPWSIVLMGMMVGVAHLLFLQNAAIAQITQATVTEILDGDEVFIDRAQDTEPAAVDSLIEFEETVRTEDSRVALLFDNGAAGRLDENSQITVGQCIEVQQGVLIASGPVNGCTANFTVGVQGTIYTLTVDEAGNHNVQVLEGEVTVDLQNSTPTSALGPVANQNSATVTAGEEVEITPEGRFGLKRLLSEKEILKILKGDLFDDFEQPLPNMDKLQTALRDLYPGIKLPSLPGFEPPRPPEPPSRRVQPRPRFRHF